MRALEPEVHALARVAASAQALALVGEYYAMRGQFDVGFPFAMRAVKADPACPRCFAVLATMLYEHHQPSEAVAMQERACGLLPEGANVARFQRALEVYRRAANGDAAAE